MYGFEQVTSPPLKWKSLEPWRKVVWEVKQTDSGVLRPPSLCRHDKVIEAPFISLSSLQNKRLDFWKGKKKKKTGAKESQALIEASFDWKGQRQNKAKVKGEFKGWNYKKLASGKLWSEYMYTHIYSAWIRVNTGQNNYSGYSSTICNTSLSPTLRINNMTNNINILDLKNVSMSSSCTFLIISFGPQL